MTLHIETFSDGTLKFALEGGNILELNRDAANRLVMAARMKNIGAFCEKLAELIPETTLVTELKKRFAAATTSSERWTLKEKFARIPTLAPGFTPSGPVQQLETVTL